MCDDVIVSPRPTMASHDTAAVAAADDADDAPTYWMIEGAIATGKTRAFTRLCAADRGRAFRAVYSENVDKTFLARFYAENSYAFALQMMMAASRVTTLQLSAHFGGAFLFDRSVVGDYVFALAVRANGDLSPQEWRMYQAYVGATPAAALAKHAAGARVRVLYTRVPVERMIAYQAARDPEPIPAAYLRRVLAVYELVIASLIDADVPVYALTDDIEDVTDAAARLTTVDTRAALSELTPTASAFVQDVLGIR